MSKSGWLCLWSRLFVSRSR